MTDEPEWEVLHKSHWDTTERLAIPGGWLVRSVWRKHLDVGQPHLDGSAVVFVPFFVELKQYQPAGDATVWPEPEITGELERPTDAQAEEVDEAESGEAGGEPEQVGLAGQDHGSRRRRPGK